jgi:EAL domain-containing protein (putative c-di-GMP-specific phosphodiesterase class I)
MVARIGADQFAIIADHLAPDTDAALDATRVAERIQQGVLPEVGEAARSLLIGATRVAQRIQQHALGSPFELGSQEIFATASIGIAVSGSSYASAEEMFRDADLAMHRAKAAGGARHEMFDRRMHARISERLHLESDLRRALDRSQFRLHYQPIVSLTDLGISGFECLLRWEHPERGLLQPKDFIRVADEMGVLVQLSAWLIREACQQVARWRRSDALGRTLSVSVNLASGAFESDELLTHVGEALAAAGSAPGRLDLELTEVAMVSNFEATCSTLDALKRLGVDVHVDDFGTGYSSLSYIHRLPVAAIKIDRSFTQRVGQDPDAERMIRTIVELGHSLDRTVIAEGIESRQQLECLRRLRCDRGQGFLFSPPVEAEQAGAFIAAPPWLDGAATA